MARNRQPRCPLLCWALALITALLGLIAGAMIALVLLFARVDPPYGMAMVWATDWQTASRLRPEWQRLDDLPRHLMLAVIAAEDQQFPLHRGFDWDSVREAVDNHVARGDRLRGASTISQQTAKNLFLWHNRSWFRKTLEAGLTATMEAIWPKRRILEIYLNLAEFGPGIYGIEHAAQHYFGRPARELDRQQSARLAAMLPAPGLYNPVNPGPRMTRRTQWVEQQMRQLGIAWLDPMLLE
ncbi:monofunctional biosynthetic peptidoglycan transglycosylase [Thioalkalivibrio sp. ALJT]|uniref:monofunctional biosynthetic peptidoglycan transglycosylase n=1 Tax=Thioalkalivibrio sp. ALJT TaxID=1158146 RepID=UPI00036F93CA|nr:monofunctional biosynthetic peptidoglycan transglycosylase [Thioalkalivibrio sp. ALJT]